MARGPAGAADMAYLKHRGDNLKRVVKLHLIEVMHTLPQCAPTGVGAGPQKIMLAAGFDFHSDHRRFYPGTRLKEMAMKGEVSAVAIPRRRNGNYYRLPVTSKFGPSRDPCYKIDLNLRGGQIIATAKKLMIERLQQLPRGEWIWLNELEKDTGLYEAKTRGIAHRGFFGWLIEKELVFDDLVEEDDRRHHEVWVRLRA
jgi:hypothetical protein